MSKSKRNKRNNKAISDAKERHEERMKALRKSLKPRDIIQEMIDKGEFPSL